jgi:hypothetical protein
VLKQMPKRHGKGGWMIRWLNEIVNWSERKVSKPKCRSSSDIVGYKVQGKCQKLKCRWQFGIGVAVHIVQSQYTNARKSMFEVQGKSQAS